tara:strand:+ start:359 stop:547 length:189 start_codon:yes stop_codon:yes gene_type:complete
MNMSKNIPTKEYMVDGWDRSPHLAVHPYRRGSRHNVIGMWVMWSYYVLITLMIVRLIVVLNT